MKTANKRFEAHKDDAPFKLFIRNWQMRSVHPAILFALLLASSGNASADDLGMRGFGDIVLLVQYYAAFFILQFIVFCIVTARRMYSGKRLSGAIYLLLPIETAVLSALVIYFITVYFQIGMLGGLLTMALTPPILWPLLHTTLHRLRSANA